jgi:hypothetical protein
MFTNQIVKYFFRHYQSYFDFLTGIKIYHCDIHRPINVLIVFLACISCGGSLGVAGYMLAQWAVPVKI